MSEPLSTVEYREIPGFPGYRVGDDGSVWSRRKRGWSNRPFADWRRLRPTVMRNGRLRISLCRGEGGDRMTKRFVHQLVLLAFVGPCPSGLEACHDNDDPADCRLQNLRWGTRKSNAADRLRNGKYESTTGEGNRNVKLTTSRVRAIRAARAAGETCKAIAAREGVSDVLVSMIARRKIWSWLP